MGIKISIEINIDENTDPKIKELAHLLTTAAISGAKVSTLNDPTEPGAKPARVRLRRPPERPPLTGTPAERWVQFLDKAPARTRDFAQLIEAGYPNFVTQADAMKALGITQAAQSVVSQALCAVGPLPTNLNCPGRLQNRTVSVFGSGADSMNPVSCERRPKYLPRWRRKCASGQLR